MLLNFDMHREIYITVILTMYHKSKLISSFVLSFCLMMDVGISVDQISWRHNINGRVTKGVSTEASKRACGREEGKCYPDKSLIFKKRQIVGRYWIHPKLQNIL